MTPRNIRYHGELKESQLTRKIDGVPCPVVEEMSYKKNCHKIANQNGNLADYVINIVVDRK